MSAASLRQAMEEELAADPDDAATHAAYADLLEEMGDPRGVFIQVQIALEDPSLPPERRQKLSQREQELYREHVGDWLGPLGPPLEATGARFAFRRGWLDLVEVETMTLRLARALRDAPLARLLSRLEVEEGYDEDDNRVPEDNVCDDDDDEGLWPLVGAACLKNVRVFRLGKDQGDADGRDLRCRLSTTAVVPLVRSMPRVEELHLFVNPYRRTTNRRHPYLTDLFALPTLTQLRVLKAYHLERVHRLDVLAANPALGNLTHLLLYPHAIEVDYFDADEADGFALHEGYLPPRMVEALARSPNLPRLTHLQLRLCGMGDAGVRALIEHGLLGRLRVLDLRFGCVTDEGARLLAACPAARSLERLDLSCNALSPAGAELLQGSGIPCRVADQMPLYGDDEVADYLFHGDYE